MEKPHDESRDDRVVADEIVRRALVLMEDLRIPRNVQLDRLFTMAAAFAIACTSSSETVRQFHKMADAIENGALSKLFGEEHTTH